MRVQGYNSKIDTARMVIESLKENVMEIFWDEDPFEFCSSRAILPLIQEEAEYSIKDLNLDARDQYFYLQMINYLLGEYCED